MSDEPPEPSAAPRWQSARAIYSAGGAAPDTRPPRRRNSRVRVLIAIALLIVLIVFASLHHHPSGSLPPGRWGLTIACLQRDGLLSVTDAAGSGTAPTGVHTTAVLVSAARHDTLLAEVRDYATPAAASAGRAHNALRAPGGDYLQDGVDLWAWIPGGTPLHLLSNAGERTIISSCVRDPR